MTKMVNPPKTFLRGFDRCRPPKENGDPTSESILKLISFHHTPRPGLNGKVESTFGCEVGGGGSPPPLPFGVGGARLVHPPTLPSVPFSRNVIFTPRISKTFFPSGPRADKELQTLCCLFTFKIYRNTSLCSYFLREKSSRLFSFCDFLLKLSVLLIHNGSFFMQLSLSCKNRKCFWIHQIHSEDIFLNFFLQFFNDSNRFENYSFYFLSVILNPIVELLVSNCLIFFEQIPFDLDFFGKISAQLLTSIKKIPR